MNKSITNLNWMSNSIEMSWVGPVPGQGKSYFQWPSVSIENIIQDQKFQYILIPLRVHACWLEQTVIIACTCMLTRTYRYHAVFIGSTNAAGWLAWILGITIVKLLSICSLIEYQELIDEHPIFKCVALPWGKRIWHQCINGNANGNSNSQLDPDSI